MAKDNSKWLEGLLKYSQDLTNYITDNEPDDSFGWGGRLRQLIALDVGQRRSGVMICGPDGCGKHTAAYHVVRELVSIKYTAFFVRGSQLGEGCASSGEVIARLDELLDHYYDEKSALCLVIDEPSECPFCAEVFNHLGMTSYIYDLNKDSVPGFFPVLISKENLYPGAILKYRLICCRMTYPSSDDRVAFLNKRGKEISKVLSLQKLAGMTDGFSYAGLIDLVDIFTMIADVSGGVISDRLVNETVENQRMRDPSAKAPSASSEKGDEILNALRGIEQAISKKGGVSMIHDNPQPEIEQTPDLNEAIKKIQTMPVRDLAISLLGEERYENLLNS